MSSFDSLGIPFTNRSLTIPDLNLGPLDRGPGQEKTFHDIEEDVEVRDVEAQSQRTKESSRVPPLVVYLNPQYRPRLQDRKEERRHIEVRSINRRDSESQK